MTKKTKGTEPVKVKEEVPPTESGEVNYQTKAEEYLNDLKRLQADFDNYKKRQAEAEKSLKGYLIEGLVLDLIPVLDNFHAATMHVPDDQKSSPWVVGIQYIEKQLETVLTENDMSLIEPAPGETFDPTKHEALEKEGEERELKDGEEIKEVVSKVHQKGYLLGNRVIRPAKVTIKQG